MATTLLKDIPLKCPNCDTYIFTAAPRPKIGHKAWLVAAIGIVATAIWIFLFFTFSEFYVTPGGLGGIIVFALIYGWPFYLSALIVWKMPMVVIAKCFKCKNKTLYKIGLPKL